MMTPKLTSLPYSRKPDGMIRLEGQSIAIFDGNGKNIDERTVESFGEEWNKFNSFSPQEIQSIGNDYFDLINLNELDYSYCLDVGCGSGRWCQYLASYAGFIEGIDPSSAVRIASKNTADLENCRITCSGVDDIPFKDESFDFVYSLGVLHHIPDTMKAMESCIRKLKPGGLFLVYLYYNMENRSIVFRGLFHLSSLVRGLVSKLPGKLKTAASDILAVTLYLPLIFISSLLEKLGLTNLAHRIPLNYYRKTSWKIIRNDALDRFGTPLEQRFSRKEIHHMMTSCGLENIEFSENAPYWHAIGRKKS